MTEPAHRMPASFQRALLFALAHHAEQLRKGTSVPYITHPVIVAETLAYHYPRSSELICAGVLHDTVEDTTATIELVRAEFGDRVAFLVAAVTKPLPESVPDLPTEQPARWTRQREAMLKGLVEHEDPDVLRLKTADALANLRAIERDLEHPEVGEGVWDRFKVGRKESLWYYDEIRKGLEPIRDEPLAKEYADLLKRLHG